MDQEKIKTVISGAKSTTEKFSDGISSMVIAISEQVLEEANALAAQLRKEMQQFEGSALEKQMASLTEKVNTMMKVVCDQDTELKFQAEIRLQAATSLRQLADLIAKKQPERK